MSRAEQPIPEFHHPPETWTVPAADLTWEPDAHPFSELSPPGAEPEAEAEAG